MAKSPSAQGRPDATKKYEIPTNSLFSKAIEQGLKAGHLPGKTKKARDWFRFQAGNLVDPRPAKLLGRGKGVSGVMPGTMYMYYYDPKHKESLPFYDRFPLIFAIDLREDGWLGINLHYLPIGYRVRLMDALYTVATDQHFDDRTKLKLSYNILKNAAKFSLFRPCIKRYLASHVKSALVEVPASDWDIAAFLPTARWEKSPRTSVYNNSISKIKNR